MESVLILPIVLFLLSGPIVVKGQGPVYLFGDNVTLTCVAAMQSAGVFIWTDTTEDIIIYTVTGPDVNQQDFDAINKDKYKNFDIDNNHPNDVNLLIKSVEVNDAGVYDCGINNQASPAPFTVSVEAMPISVSISCARSSPTDNCSSPSSPTSDSFSCNCTAFGAYPETLQFDWSGGATVCHQSDSDNNERTGTFDIYTDAEIVPTENPGSVTCTLNGYNQTWEGVRNATYTFNPPMCELKTTCIKTGNAVSLTCTCNDASPAEGLVYIFYRDGELLSSGDTNVVEADIEVDQEYIFSCRGCNGLNYGSESNDTQTVMCQRSTTVLPTTTITTVPLSTNEPTSTKAMGTTTVEPESKSTDNPESGGLGTGAIVGISLGALAVVIVILVITLMMFKPGKCASISDSSHATDGNSTAKGVDIYEDELPLGINEMKAGVKKSSNSDTRNESKEKEAPAPVYAEVKKKSGKQDYKGPGKYPDIPPHGVINKKKAKGPTPAPSSSMRDSTNSTKPQQQTGNQSADTDHSKESPQDEMEYVNIING